MRSEEQSSGATSLAAGVVALPSELTAVAAAGAPHIAQVNVSRNSRMHIGPQFVSVTQNVHRDRVVKGRLLGLELQAGTGGGERTRRLRCSVAVCVCWALVVAVALAVYAARLALAPPAPRRIDLGINASWYLRRGDWQAMPEYALEAAGAPARFALVGHSAGEPCADRYACIRRVLDVQREHLRRGWLDIGPNFLVGGGDAGLVLEGRGAGVIGVMTFGWNRAVSIMWLGDYRHSHDAPTAAQLRHVRVLLAALVAAGTLHPSYELLGHCQVVPWTFSPGVRLLRALPTLEHWRPTNVSACLEWNGR